MSRRSLVRLKGALRIVPDVDSIGIPVFAAADRNCLFVPEMDEDFRITRFMDFMNEEGYTLDETVPEPFRNGRYSIAEPTPIPFWFDGRLEFVPGDAQPDELQKVFGDQARKNPVLVDLGSLLADARTGKLKERRQHWTADEIATGYGDVFYEPPVHSRYWLSRYRVALARARSLTQPPHPIDRELLRVGLEWLRRFGTKTDFPRVMALLGEPEEGVFTLERARRMVFGFFAYRIINGTFENISKHVQDPSLERLFPFGMHDFFYHHGWPKNPFRYDHPPELLSLLKDTLREANRYRRYDQAARMTFLFFRRTALPYDLDDLARISLNEETEFLLRQLKESQVVFGRREVRQEWSVTAQEIVAQLNRVMDLDGIVHGESRLSRKFVPDRYGMSKYYYEDLLKYIS